MQSGDTLSGVAAALWGDASLWWKLAEVNGLSAESTLVEGQLLIIPVGVQTNANNASTFQPYDPLEVLGNLSPTAPKPAKGKNCGGVGQVLLAVIAIAIIVHFGPQAMQFFGNMFAGGGTAGAAAVGQIKLAIDAGVVGAKLGAAAIGGMVAGGAAVGAAASIVTQGIGVATGIQEKFSWNAVAMAAIGGAVGGAVNVGMSGAAAWQQAMVSSAITQGIGKATGLQDKFSWAAVAAAGVGAWAGNEVGRISGLSGQGGEFAMRGASALANAATRSLIDGSDFGDNMLEALPDLIGQTIGEMVAGAVSYSREPEGSWDGEEKPYGSYAKQNRADETIVVTGQRPERRGILEQIWGGIEFGAGALFGFGRDTVQGLLSLGDYVIRDMGGSALYWINEGIDAIIPGDLPNGYEQSWADYTNANNTAGALIGRVFTDFGGLVRDVRAEYSAATARSNAQESAFARGASNPTASLILNAATLPLAITKGRAVSGLGQLSRAGGTADAAQAVRGLDGASDAARAAEAAQAARLLQAPQGLTQQQFLEAARIVQARAAELGLGDDIFVHGSRAAGTATASSDIDFAIRLAPEAFETFLNTQSRLASPNPGSSLARTREYAITQGMIQRGEARLSGTGAQLERMLGMPVDLSVVRAGGPMDTGPRIFLPRPPTPPGG